MAPLPYKEAEELFVNSVDDVQIQTRLFTPKNWNGNNNNNNNNGNDNDNGNDNKSCKLAIVSHPYGRLDANWYEVGTTLVSSVAYRSGWCVVQYQSRGVLESTGSGSFTCLPEIQDFEAVTKTYIKKFLNQDPPCKITELLLAGCSAGALSASSARDILDKDQEKEIRLRFLVVSYPLTPLPFLTLFGDGKFKKAVRDIADQYKQDVMVIHGDCDQLTGKSRYENWGHDLEQRGAKVFMIQDGDHFWTKPDSRQAFIDSLTSWL